LKTTEKLNKYNIQVNPREINLFIPPKTNKIEYSEDEILTLLDTNPEMFSPNVIMRPLYQEVILPNHVTFGGGEIAYWLN
jgi:uncharacterized protein YllA (UPF0747 family)